MRRTCPLINYPLPTAINYCEANFGAIDGRTANGLVRHSERYEILPVIDSEKAGLDAGMMVLDGGPDSILVCRDLAESLEKAVTVPDYFIFGRVPSKARRQLAALQILEEALGTLLTYKASPATK